MSELTRGYHRLTINFVYQAYTGGAWVDRDTVVPYGVSFQVSAPASRTSPAALASRTLTDNATSISVSGRIHRNAMLTVKDMGFTRKALAPPATRYARHKPTGN